MKRISVVTVTEKRCSKCGSTKPAVEFYRDASSATGLDSCCRECRRQYARSRPKRDTPAVEEKVCSHCNCLKPASEFGKNARETTGLQPWCRACHSTYVNQKPKVDAPCVTEKRCSKCGVVKSAADFCKDKYKPSGLRSWCRECRNRARAATRQERPCVPTQKCRGCGVVKPAQAFPRCKENASGLKSVCNGCVEERSYASRPSTFKRWAGKRHPCRTEDFSEAGQTASSTQTGVHALGTPTSGRSTRRARLAIPFLRAPEELGANESPSTAESVKLGAKRGFFDWHTAENPSLPSGSGAPLRKDDPPPAAVGMGHVRRVEPEGAHDACGKPAKKRRQSNGASVSALGGGAVEESKFNNGSFPGLYLLIRAAETVAGDSRTN